MIQKDYLAKVADAWRSDLLPGIDWGTAWAVHLLKALPGGGLNPEIDLAAVAGGEADFRGYASVPIDPRAFSSKAWLTSVGWIFYFEEICGFLFDPDVAGSDSNSIVGFFVENDGALVGVKEFASPVTIDVDNPSRVFKVRGRVWTDA